MMISLFCGSAALILAYRFYCQSNKTWMIVCIVVAALLFNSFCNKIDDKIAKNIAICSNSKKTNYRRRIQK